MRDKTSIVSKKKKKKFSHSHKSYVFNEVGTVACERREGDSLKVNNFTSFKHKKKANVRSSTRPQGFNKPPEVCTDFYFENDEVFSNFKEFNLDEHLIVHGCYDTNFHTIQKQIDCKNFSGERLPIWNDYLLLKNAVRDSIRKLQIEVLGEVNITDMDDFDFNLDTMAGYRYENYFGAKSKRDCVDLALEISRIRYKNIVKASKEKRIIKRNEVVPGIYSIGARNTRKTEIEEGEDLNSRAVHMPEWHTELHGGLFSDLITAHLVEKGVGPIYIGNSFVDYTRLSDQLEQNFCAIEGDWSKFDATLCNSLITIAVCILRLYFPSTLLYDNHLLAVLDSLIIKDYHVVGGKVLRILHGLPSGSKWTSLVGSILNLVVLNYSFSGVKYYDRSFAIGGDDFVTFIRSDNYDVNKIREEVYNNSTRLGMNLKFFKEKFYKKSENVEDYPVFYKYTVFKNLPVVPIDSILERVLSPWNKQYGDTLKILKFLDDVLPSLGYPTSSCFIFYQFYIYCYFKMTKKKIPVEELVKRHYFIYKKMMDYNISSYDLKDDYYKNKRNVFNNRIKLNSYARLVFKL